MIPLSVPYISGNEWKYVKDCLDSGWISSAGSYVSKFENIICEYTGAKNAIACMNGTSALQISLLLSNVTKDDIVIAPNLTFVATLNAISYCNAEPVLVDIDETTWQIDIDLLEKWILDNCKTEFENGLKVTKENDSNKTIKAIVPVHVLGGICDMEKLCEFTEKYGIKIIEDSTEALGTVFNGKHAGLFGEFGTLSFNGNKIISTGGGGIILTNDSDLAKRAKHLTTTAKTDPINYYHDMIGYNYRLVNILAAVGLAQMENFDQILIKKKYIDHTYKKELANIGDIIFQKNHDLSDPNCWLFTFRTTRAKHLINYLNQKNIQSRPFWTPMNQLPMYSKLKYITQKMISNKIFSECISIPSSSNLLSKDQAKVISEIKKFYNNDFS